VKQKKKTVHSITLIKCDNITQIPNITVRQNSQPLYQAISYFVGIC